MEEKGRQKNTGLNFDDWEITLNSSDTDSILAMYTLAQNEATNETIRPQTKQAGIVTT